MLAVPMVAGKACHGTNPIRRVHPPRIQKDEPPATCGILMAARDAVGSGGLRPGEACSIQCGGEYGERSQRSEISHQRSRYDQWHSLLPVTRNGCAGPGLCSRSRAPEKAPRFLTCSSGPRCGVPALSGALGRTASRLPSCAIPCGQSGRNPCPTSSYHAVIGISWRQSGATCAW